MPDLTDPMVQLKYMIGELLVTIAQLEAQKAALTIKINTVVTTHAETEPTP